MPYGVRWMEDFVAVAASVEAPPLSPLHNKTRRQISLDHS